MKARVIWFFGTIVALMVCYVMSRHDVLGWWHFMRQWPFVLMAAGLAVIVVAVFSDSRKVMASVPAGYIIGFVLATMFNTYDESGVERTNNGWAIWAITLLSMVIIGFVWEMVHKRMVRKRKTGIVTPRMI